MTSVNVAYTQEDGQADFIERKWCFLTLRGRSQVAVSEESKEFKTGRDVGQKDFAFRERHEIKLWLVD